MLISSISRSGWCSGSTYTQGPKRRRRVRCATAARKTFWEGARLWMAGVWCSAR